MPAPQRLHGHPLTEIVCVQRASWHAKNIVLLSDGTGNSSAKLMKTNVWRMYEAVELTTGDQLALYDNGVGTSSFKPLAMLGGGLGWGLKRNVRALYMFACANYRPGDRIFAFGFSRGAFTIRVLMGLIKDQGLITGVKGRELERRAKWAYRAYRRQFNPTGGLVTPLRGDSRLAAAKAGAQAAVQQRRQRQANGGLRRPLGHRRRLRPAHRRDDARLGPMGVAADDDATTRIRTSSKSCAMQSRSTTSGTRFTRCCSTSRTNRSATTSTRSG